ncbi:hypothetical protein VMCG_10084 [Cytospora schulzeri]|uniref:4-hydroxy-2-oxoglutarate aldolase, mitochondrial n=1 Tax=Cytospora schulzeri TaxID=448051 RepID=A0A423VG36_9PEZI|nr:hypothetical protein VMCG_10084 [Valsa malicola]
MAPPKVPQSGVWCPAVTMFDPETDTLDLESQAKYYSYLSRSGLTGLVILGTNAEAFLLTREERKALIACAREACGPDYPIMAGVGAHSTRQVLELIDDAAAAGANYVLCLPPGYFGKATTPAVVERFFDDVATNSSLPIVIYNFPGVCNGVDLDSGIITKLANKHPGSIVGVKLTCGSVAKIVRLAAVLPREQFATFGGQSDFILGGLTSGSAGCVAAFANAFPKSISKIYQLWQEGKTEEALKLHQKAALAEQACKSGIAATKYAAAIFAAKAAGVEDAVNKLKPRRPYMEPSNDAKKVVEETMAEMASIEAGIP